MSIENAADVSSDTEVIPLDVEEDGVAPMPLDIDSEEFDKEYQEALAEVRKEESGEKAGEEKPKSETVKEEAKQEPKSPESKAEGKTGPKITGPSLEAKVGDGNLTIPLTAAIPVTINGETTEVPLDELRRIYSSKQATKKEREAFLAQEREFKKDKEDFSTLIGEGLEAIKGGKIAAGLAVFAELLGQEPFEMVKGLRRGILENAREYLDMTDDEREKQDRLEEADYLRDKMKKQTEKGTKAAQAKAFQDSIYRVIEEFGIADGAEYNRLATEAFDYAQTQKAQGHLPKDFQVTPETVGHYYLGQKATAAVAGALQEVAPELLNDAAVVKDLYEYAAKNRSSQADIVSVIMELRNQTPSPAKASSGSGQAPKLETEEELFAELENIDPGLDLDKTPQLSKLRNLKK